MKINNHILILLIVFGLAFPSCKKDGTGGNAEIVVTVKHQGVPVPAATVYIKYGATQSPGTDLSLYDHSKVTGTVGHAAGHTHITELLRGDYYIHAVGIDSATSTILTGGIHVNISKSRESVERDLPVTD